MRASAGGGPAPGRLSGRGAQALLREGLQTGLAALLGAPAAAVSVSLANSSSPPPTVYSPVDAAASLPTVRARKGCRLQALILPRRLRLSSCARTCRTCRTVFSHCCVHVTGPAALLAAAAGRPLPPALWRHPPLLGSAADAGSGPAEHARCRRSRRACWWRRPAPPPYAGRHSLRPPRSARWRARQGTVGPTRRWARRPWRSPTPGARASAAMACARRAHTMRAAASVVSWDIRAQA